MFVEQRSQERVKASGDVYYSDIFRKDVPQKHYKQYEGQVVDICTSGICISTLHKFERGSIVMFQIEKHCEGIFTGFVRRCIKNSDDNYHVGLEVPFRNDSNIH